MLLLYDEILFTWWWGKSRTITATIAPNILECFGSIHKGQFTLRVWNICKALLCFTWICAHQRVSHMAYVMFYDTCNIWHASNFPLKYLPPMWTMFSKAHIAYLTSFKTRSCTCAALLHMCFVPAQYTLHFHCICASLLLNKCCMLVYMYSGLQNCCNVWPFSTGLNVALNRVGIVLRVG